MSWREWARGAEIEPSIYAADRARLGEQLADAMGAGAPSSSSTSATGTARAVA